MNLKQLELKLKRIFLEKNVEKNVKQLNKIFDWKIKTNRLQDIFINKNFINFFFKNHILFQIEKELNEDKVKEINEKKENLKNIFYWLKNNNINFFDFYQAFYYNFYFYSAIVLILEVFVLEFITEFVKWNTFLWIILSTISILLWLQAFLLILIPKNYDRLPIIERIVLWLSIIFWLSLIIQFTTRIYQLNFYWFLITIFLSIILLFSWYYFNKEEFLLFNKAINFKKGKIDFWTKIAYFLLISFRKSFVLSTWVDLARLFHKIKLKYFENYLNNFFYLKFVLFEKIYWTKLSLISSENKFNVDNNVFLDLENSNVNIYFENNKIDKELIKNKKINLIKNELTDYLMFISLYFLEVENFKNKILDEIEVEFNKINEKIVKLKTLDNKTIKDLEKFNKEFIKINKKIEKINKNKRMISWIKNFKEKNYFNDFFNKISDIEVKTNELDLLKEKYAKTVNDYKNILLQYYYFKNLNKKYFNELKNHLKLLKESLKINLKNKDFDPAYNKKLFNFIKIFEEKIINEIELSFDEKFNKFNLIKKEQSEKLLKLRNEILEEIEEINEIIKNINIK